MIKVKTSTSELTFESWKSDKSHLPSLLYHNCPHLSYHWLYQKSVLLLTFSHFTDHLPTPYPLLPAPPPLSRSHLILSVQTALRSPILSYPKHGLIKPPLPKLLLLLYCVSSILLRLAIMLSTNRPHIYSHLSLQTSQHLYSRRETSPSWSLRYPEEWKNRRHWIVCSYIEYLTKWRCFAISGAPLYGWKLLVCQEYFCSR